ncbi:hypothetical protein [Falsiroseomonas oryzae]|uniref:hypothetical protein n=1 Tax=Falsiroseomonas oryzae TaxID=2766473 RepID=UPI0022EA9D62|nr:hypothetical protein [Roseomonas sp. MO-31]
MSADRLEVTRENGGRRAVEGSATTPDTRGKLLQHFEVTGPVVFEPDGIVVKGDCRPRAGVRLRRLPVRFACVEGVFDCSALGLETLDGAPTVVGDDLLCQYNALRTLGTVPLRVRGDVRAEGNPLDVSQPLLVAGSSIGRLFCSPSPDEKGEFGGVFRMARNLAPGMVRQALLVEYHPRLPILSLLARPFHAGFVALLFNGPHVVDQLLETYAVMFREQKHRALLQMQRVLTTEGFAENAKV